MQIFPSQTLKTMKTMYEWYAVNTEPHKSIGILNILSKNYSVSINTELQKRLAHSSN